MKSITIFSIVILYFITCSLAESNSLESDYHRLDSLSDYYIEIDKDQAVKYAIDMINVAKNLENNERIGAAYDRLGYIYSNMGDYGEAIYNYLKSIHYRRKYADSIEIGETYANLAFSFYKARDFDKAILYNERSINILKKYPNNEHLKAAYFQLSRIYRGKKAPSKSLEYINIGLEVAKKSNNKRQLALEYTFLASLYRSLNLYDSALKYDNGSLKLGIEIKDTTAIARAFNNIGFNYHCLGKYRAAIKYFNSSISLNDKEEIANTYLSATDSYMMMGKIKDAEKCLQLAILNNPRNLTDVANTVNSITNLCIKKKDLEGIAKYHSLYKTITDSIAILNSSDYNIAYESKYAQSGEEKYFAEREKEFFSVVNQMQRKELIAGAILLVVVLIILIIILERYVRNIKSKKKLSSDFKFANNAFKEIINRYQH